MRLSILRAASPAPVMPQPIQEGEPDPRYPRNNRGQVEFGSVLLTLDHLMDADPFHVNQKCVYSTRSASDMLIHLMQNVYRDERNGFANSPETFEILKALDGDPLNTIALYFVPATTRDRTGGLIAQVCLSVPALQRLVAHPKFGDGSSLEAMNNLVIAVSLLADKARIQMGAIPPLMLMQLSDPAAEGQPGEQSA